MSRSPTTDSAAGTSRPAPTPCSIRNTSNTPMACERHTKIVARVNSPIPARYIGRAPIRSVTTPAHGRTSVDASRLAPMTHAYASGCPSSAMIVGVAVASSVCCSVEAHMPSIAAHNAITTRRESGATSSRQCCQRQVQLCCKPLRHGRAVWVPCPLRYRSEVRRSDQRHRRVVIHFTKLARG